jgi:hypothetical protein
MNTNEVKNAAQSIFDNTEGPFEVILYETPDGERFEEKRTAEFYMLAVIAYEAADSYANFFTIMAETFRIYEKSGGL